MLMIKSVVLVAVLMLAACDYESTATSETAVSISDGVWSVSMGRSSCWNQDGSGATSLSPGEPTIIRVNRDGTALVELSDGSTIDAAWTDTPADKTAPMYSALRYAITQLKIAPYENDGVTWNVYGQGPRIRIGNGAVVFWSVQTDKVGCYASGTATQAMKE